MIRGVRQCYDHAPCWTGTILWGGPPVRTSDEHRDRDGEEKESRMRKAGWGGGVRNGGGE
eukprot:4992998-Pyramimonas_sp.AAC.1